MVRRLCGADDVRCLEALGAFQQVKLHGLTLIERAVAVLLDGGEVHEYIFPRGALDKSIALRPVEPLDCTFLSHGKKLLSPIAKNCSPAFPIVAPVEWGSPSKKLVEPGCVYDVRKKYSPKRKRLLSSCRGLRPQREHPEPDNLARFNHTLQTSTRTGSHYRTKSR